VSSERIATNDDSCGSLCSYLEVACPESGVMSVLTGTYRSQLESVCNLEWLGATLCPVDALEPNDDPAEPPLVAVGQVDDLSLCRGEHEYYAIFANEPDRIEVTVRPDAEDVEVQLEVFGPGGELLEMAQGAGPEVRLSAAVGDAGAHRLSVRLLRGSVTSYSLEIQLPLDE
jgi:hypothetical protein